MVEIGTNLSALNVWMDPAKYEARVAMTIKKRGTHKVKQYILNNFFTIKQVTNLCKKFTDICTESPVEEMRLAAQMLDFTFFQDIEEEKFETIPLPTQITAHRRKMIDQLTSAYKIPFEHDIRTYIESLKGNIIRINKTFL
uniref:BACK domain-containing protein n=1 Tax=Parastrongyloides trichosuri TaxID=131310 RepID=A0A0N4Z5H6_PARTI